MIVLCCVSCTLSLVYAFFNLHFLADRAALVDSGERLQQISNNFQREFPKSEDIVVLIDGGRTQEREQFVDQLAARLGERKDLFTGIFAKVELSFLMTHALSYLDVNDLERLVESLGEARGIVSSLSTQSGIGSMLAHSASDLEKMLPMLNEILGQFLKALQTRGRYQYASPWGKALFEGSAPGDKGSASQDLLKEAKRTVFYNTISNGEKHLLLVKAAGDDVMPVIETLRQEISRLRTNFPGLEVGITGEPVLDLDEMESSTRDSTRATLWSLVLVMCSFLVSFRYLSRPVMVLVALAISLGWTIGFTTVAIGHLNLLTVTFATMLIGLGTDFGIHVIYAYEEQRAHGSEPYAAMCDTAEHAGVEILTGAVTTAIAFWAIRFTDFRGVAELGLIAGTGVIFAFLANFTILPAMMFIQERRTPMPEESRPFWARALAAAEEIYLSRPWWIVAASLVISLWSLSLVHQVKFDYNLLNLQSRKLPSVQTELKLMSDSHGVLFAVALASSLEEAAVLSKKFSDLHSVNRVESVLPLVPTDYQRKIPLLKKIESIMAELPLPDADGPAGAGTGSGLRKMGEGFMQLEQTFSNAYPTLLQSPDPEVRRQAKRFKELLTTLFSTLEKMGPGPISDGVTAFQRDLFSDLRGMLEFLKSQRAEPPITLDSLPPLIRERSVGRSGKILLRIYPHGNPWDRDPLTRFVHDLQKVDPDVVGTPVMVYYHTEALKRAYEVSGWYALGAITVVLFVHFRQVKNTLLALLPKLVGVLWMLGAMGQAGIDFNPANFMALPLILGIGLIFGVHVVHRLLDQPQQGIFSHSTGPAIALSAASTIFGFGTLMVAKHQGIASLGFLMAVGVGANLLTSLILLPAVMRLLHPAPPNPT